MRPLLLNLIIIFLFFNACKKETTGLQREKSLTNYHPNCSECSILFIGSSYTSYLGNDVPEIFNQFAEAADKSVYIDRAVIGGHRLKDHAVNEQTLAKINEKKWDFVILQGGSIYLSNEKWHDLLKPHLQTLREHIKANSPNTCVIYMLPWAYKDGLEWLEGESNTYEQMQQNLYEESIKLAEEMDVVVSPVGWIWYQAIQNGVPEYLYLTDNSHQSRYGAFLTASVYFTTVFLEAASPIFYKFDEDDNPFYFMEDYSEIVLQNLDLWNIYQR